MWPGGFCASCVEKGQVSHVLIVSKGNTQRPYRSFFFAIAFRARTSPPQNPVRRPFLHDRVHEVLQILMMSEVWMKAFAEAFGTPCGVDESTSRRVDRVISDSSTTPHGSQDPECQVEDLPPEMQSEFKRRAEQAGATWRISTRHRDLGALLGSYLVDLRLLCSMWSECIRC